jgi:hypothetical protein
VKRNFPFELDHPLYRAGRGYNTADTFGVETLARERDRKRARGLVLQREFE